MNHFNPELNSGSEIEGASWLDIKRTRKDYEEQLQKLVELIDNDSSLAEKLNNGEIPEELRLSFDVFENRLFSLEGTEKMQKDIKMSRRRFLKAMGAVAIVYPLNGFEALLKVVGEIKPDPKESKEFPKTIVETEKGKENLPDITTDCVNKCNGNIAYIERFRKEFQNKMEERGFDVSDSQVWEAVFLDFVENVAPKGRWDYKVKDYKDLGAVVVGGEKKFKDFLGNMNFGFIGKHLGIPSDILFLGAGAVQQLSDLRSLKKRLKGENKIKDIKRYLKGTKNKFASLLDYAEDQQSIWIGILLFQKMQKSKDKKVTEEMLREAAEEGGKWSGKSINLDK